MRAALLLELGRPLEIEDVELLAPGPHDVIVQPGATAGATIRRDVPRFAGLMQAGLVDPAPLVDRRFTLEEINDAFAAAEAREVLTGVVVTG